MPTGFPVPDQRVQQDKRGKEVKGRKEGKVLHAEVPPVKVDLATYLGSC